MDTTTIPSFHLIGLAFPGKTTNENGQANIDCGNLWQRFEKEGIYAKIPGKLDQEIYAVYHDYDGDHTKPYAYFIGCKVGSDTNVPEGLTSLMIPEGNYQKVLAKGQMPICVGEVWRGIWGSDMHRAYVADFEIYGERSQDWGNAEVDIFVRVNK